MRETPYYGGQPTDRPIDRPRGIADCDNVAENKLGHDGGPTGRQRMERKPAFGQTGPASDSASQMAMREEFAESR